MDPLEEWSSCGGDFAMRRVLKPGGGALIKVFQGFAGFRSGWRAVPDVRRRGCSTTGVRVAKRREVFAG
jgi:hypothetical protein